MKAKRGDLIVLETNQTDYVIGRGSSARREYVVGIVRAITREGIVKRAQFYGGSLAGIEIPRYWNVSQTFVVSQKEVDAPAAAQAAWDNPWPHAPEHKGKNFDSLDEVKATLTPHKQQAAA